MENSLELESYNDSLFNIPVLKKLVCTKVQFLKYVFSVVTSSKLQYLKSESSKVTALNFIIINLSKTNNSQSQIIASWISNCLARKPYFGSKFQLWLQHYFSIQASCSDPPNHGCNVLKSVNVHMFCHSLLNAVAILAFLRCITISKLTKLWLVHGRNNL